MADCISVLGFVAVAGLNRPGIGPFVRGLGMYGSISILFDKFSIYILFCWSFLSLFSTWHGHHVYALRIRRVAPRTKSSTAWPLSAVLALRIPSTSAHIMTWPTQLRLCRRGVPAHNAILEEKKNLSSQQVAVKFASELGRINIFQQQ